MHENYEERTNINKTCKFNYNEYAIVERVQSIQLIRDTKKEKYKIEWAKEWVLHREDSKMLMWECLDAGIVCLNSKSWGGAKQNMSGLSLYISNNETVIHQRTDPQSLWKLNSIICNKFSENHSMP